VVLTSRDAGKSGRVPMCGIPYHAADTYIAKLIKAGLKVAICEQVEDPALAKGIVKREVIRVITSGTYIDDSSYESRFIIALSFKDKHFGLAFTDTASGTILANEYPDIRTLSEVISRIPVFECIFPSSDEEEVRLLFKQPLLRLRSVTLSPYEDWAFNTDICRKSLTEHFHTHNLRGFGIDELSAAVSAGGALLAYLKQMNKTPMRHIDRISLYADSEHVFISPAASFGLELDGLFKTIDHTLTALGRRKLRDWMYHPLKSAEQIRGRQDAVTALKDDPGLSEQLGRSLRNIVDIEKSISRLSCNTASARDLLALRLTLERQPEIARILAGPGKINPLFKLDDLPQLRALLCDAISPDIPLANPEGKIIRKGYNKELDELRQMMEHGRDWLKELQAQEIKRTGINSLKIGFNSVFGYYIEISKANLDKAPQDYIRKQTLANAERYITPQLKEFEEKILTAEEKVFNLERTLVEEISKAVLDDSGRLHLFSGQLATLDALYSLSILAKSSGFCAPRICEDYQLLIKDGRHPAVEQSIQEPFIPNDTLLDCSDNHLIILTGPNMAGKSTYIRQTAVLVILAQMGSYIPAAEAAIGIVDKIFTRIGAHDEITRGQSTFMVEMSETAGILNNLSARSLVVLDEIGRGTSTFDGLSLAWAISEHLAQKKVRTLFATHFHELTALAEEFPGVKNYNVAVKEWHDEVIFLHKIVAGGTDDSYGIYVAKLAGIPQDVVKQAQKILTRLEISGNLQDKIRSQSRAEDQLQLFSNNAGALYEQIQKEIKAVDLDKITPLEALNKLQKFKEKLESDE
jgi:DNA mismatch repair protein MutS